jgi:hypothetical protein
MRKKSPMKPLGAPKNARDEKKVTKETNGCPKKSSKRQSVIRSIQAAYFISWRKENIALGKSYKKYGY